MSRTQHGYAWEREIRDSLLHLGEKTELYFHKLVDTHTLDYSIWCDKCKSRVGHNLILPKSMCDYIVVTRYNVYFLECKSCKQPTSFPFGNIDDHQISTALKLSYLDKPFYFLICNRSKPKNFGAYAITPRGIDNLIYDLSPKKSVKWKILDERCKIIPQIKGGLWDLSEVIK